MIGSPPTTDLPAKYFHKQINAISAPLDLTVRRMRCEYLDNPLGVDAEQPRLSWELSSNVRGEGQSAYRILVSTSRSALRAGKGDLWDSGKVRSDATTSIRYHGRTLKSAEQCYWTVRVWDASGRPVDGPVASWRMGLLKPSEWKAQWISSDAPRDVQIDGSNLPPAPYFRRTFFVNKPIRQATAFVTAHGVYEFHLNGAKVGDAVLTPGWTDYKKRVEYQTYDVTKALRTGSNTVGAIVGDGWYCGYVGFGHHRDYYGNRPDLRLQMEIDYVDGSHQSVVTDDSWRTKVGPIVYSDLLQGESFDARKELTGWDTPAANVTGWLPASIAVSTPSMQRDVTAQLQSRVADNSLTVVVNNDIAGDPAYLHVKQLHVEYTLGDRPYAKTLKEGDTLRIPAPREAPGPLVIRKAVYGVLDEKPATAAMVGQHAPSIRITQHLTPVSIAQPKPGAYVFDLGQNMVGWVRLKVKGDPGTIIRLRFAEMLNPDGTIYTTNLRSARATDTYVCRSGGVETWEPHFTFHGFRYVEVVGYPGKPGLDAITGCVVGSDTPEAGTFTCSNAMVNKLQHNIVWGQRGNFLSVPTDCPQRDERLGWMGDAQIFARTATYNRDVAAFYEKWLQDVEDGQSSEGGFSDVSPRVVDPNDGAPAWGDAGIIVPWTVYQAYGDVDVVRKHWTAMSKWMNYITSVNANGLWLNRRNNDFGDWLSINADTPKDVLATAYYAYDAELMAKMAAAIGKPQEAAQYTALFERIKTAFNQAFVDADGRIKGDTQTDYVLALRFGLLPSNLRPLAAKHLTDNIASKDWHLSTGFVGVGYLCPSLTATGNNDVAYRLLLNDTFPSWGFSIKQGATTIWERWDGWTPERGFQDPGMNSFNHYSLGSVGQWLYQDVAGIDTDLNQPGFKHILLHPHPGKGLTSAKATYDSAHGEISSAWKTENGRLLWDVTVPANTTATAWVPSAGAASVTESGKPVGKAQGVSVRGTEPGFVVCELESGTYHFASAVSGR
jgi:alpha-L-rhamnosidase